MINIKYIILEKLDDLADTWHAQYGTDWWNPEYPSLMNFLGMNQKEYYLWVTDSDKFVDKMIKDYKESDDCN